MGRKRDEVGSQSSPTAQPALPWGMEKTEMQPSSMTAMTDDKLARFVLGHQKKTKFQKEREDREAKKRQADAEAAKIYATFVASFDNKDETRGKAFVRGEMTQGKQVLSGDRQEGEVYRLKGNDAVTVGGRPGKKVSEMDKMLQEIKQKEAGKMQRSQQVQTAQKPKKRRAIDEFLEEMKERGPAPVPLETFSGGMAKGSFDNGDPETTNLYVGNLAPTVTEETLQAEFGRFGEVYSVKIMWPRSEEERARKRNCGFVSFYERRDADDARVALNEKELEGQPMIVGWGKAVKIQPRARSPGMLLQAAVTPSSAAIAARAAPDQSFIAESRTIPVVPPADNEMKRRIDRLAAYVATDGLQFENAVRIRESGNKTDYIFLFESRCAEALYYRWRVYAFAMGDNEFSWHEQPFQMMVGGSMWVPPKMSVRSQEDNKRYSSPRSSAELSRTSRRRRSRSYSRSRSRSQSLSPRRSRRRSRSRHRSRSRSTSSADSHGNRRSRRHWRQSRSRSRNRGHRSRSWSSDDSGARKRSRRSRSRSQSWREDRDGPRGRNKTNSRSDREPSSVNMDEKHLTGQQIARARDVERGRERSRLSSEDYDDFKDLLRELTLERESVKKTMGFALDNSEAAVDLVHIILEEFKSSTASGVTLVGLLYLTSDILHNSSAAVKNASLFRTTFQDCLPQIMEALRISHKSIVGRMSANSMKDKVMNVLTAWESWSLFPPAVLVGLHATFLRKIEEEEYVASHVQALDGMDQTDLERLRKTCRQAGIMSDGDVRQLAARLHWLKEFTSPTTATATPSVAITEPSTSKYVNAAQQPKAHDISGGKSCEAEKRIDDDLDGEPMDEDGLDGEPIDETHTKESSELNIDGEPLDEEDLDGEPLDADTAGDNLDGEPLDDEDLDGAPLDDDELDGEPL